MILKENADRNFLIYELWTKGYTIKEISDETGIPEGSIAYYVRKFNKKSRRGEPITTPSGGSEKHFL